MKFVVISIHISLQEWLFVNWLFTDA